MKLALWRLKVRLLDNGVLRIAFVTLGGKIKAGKRIRAPDNPRPIVTVPVKDEAGVRFMWQYK